VADEHARRSVALAATLGGFLAGRLTIGHVTAALGCSELAAAQVLVCREPRRWRWRSDVATIARLAEVDAEALALLLGR